MYLKHPFILIDRDRFYKQSDNIEALRIEVTSNVECALAEGLGYEKYETYTILSADDMKAATFAVYSQGHGYIDARGRLIKEGKSKALKYEDMKRAIAGEREEDVVLYVYPAEGTGTKPEPLWTPELEKEVSDLRRGYMAFLCANPHVAFEGDGDGCELF